MKLGYRPDEAAEVVGGMEVLKSMVAAGWLQPVLQRKKLTVYNYGDLEKCWQRIVDGDALPPRPRKEKEASC